MTAALVLLSSLATALMFPYWVDPEADQTVRSREYYARAYTQAVSTGSSAVQPLSEKEEIYIKSARQMAEFYHVPDVIRNFVADYTGARYFAHRGAVL
jgi:hypothetical protein